MESKKKNGFASGIGFILAAAGSAVGLGNLWSFPYKTSAHGGAAFVLVYILSVIVIGSIVMIAEIYLGKRAQANPVTAYKKANKGLGWLGLFAIIIPFFITCYYSVLGGYTVKFTLNSFGTEAYANSEILGAFSGNIGEPILYTAIFMLLAIIVIVGGVKDGIEKASKVLMPALFIILVGIVIYCLTLPSNIEDGVKTLQAQYLLETDLAKKNAILEKIEQLKQYTSGLDYYLNPRFDQLGFDGVLAAMSQAFYSLSLGMGIMVSYGSYTGKEIKVGKSVTMICIFDTLVALLAGLAIFPAIASLQPAKLVDAKGVSLLFSIIPAVFSSLGVVGEILSFLFFGMVIIAALTSVMSLLEVVTQFVIQKFKFSRKKSIIFVAIIAFIISIPVSISLGFAINDEVKMTIFGQNWLDFFDIVTNTVLMPVCALCSCLAIGWFIDKKPTLNPFETLKTLKDDGLDLGLFGKIFVVMVKFITPILIAVIEVFGLIDILFPVTTITPAEYNILGQVTTPAVTARQLSGNGLGIVLTSVALLALAFILYQIFFKNNETGTNADELIHNAVKE